MELQIKYRNISDLVPNPKNPRKTTENAVKTLAESIKANPKFFEARPILLSNRTGQLVILGGERRYDAARYLQMKKAPTILFEGLTEEQENEIIIKDNTHAGEWDVTKIFNEWNAEQVRNWGVKMLESFDSKDWDELKPTEKEVSPNSPFFKISLVFDGQYSLQKDYIIEKIKIALQGYGVKFV